MKLQEAKKYQIEDIREPFYRTVDGIGQFAAVSKKLKDPKLDRYIQQLQKLQHEIIQHLNNTYIWD